jgi:heat shock protein HslJ
MEFERDLMNILTDYRSWKQQHHQLLLIARTGDVLLFERHSPAK